MGLFKAAVIVALLAQTPQQYRIGDVKITGNKELPKAIFVLILNLNTGAVYDEAELQKHLQDTKRLYATRGYINPSMNVRKDFDEQKKIVNLSIEVDEDRQFTVKSIRFVSNQAITDDAIRRELLVKEGNIFNAANWDSSMMRLNQLGYFEPNSQRGY